MQPRRTASAATAHSDGEATRGASDIHPLKRRHGDFIQGQRRLPEPDDLPPSLDNVPWISVEDVQQQAADNGERVDPFDVVAWDQLERQLFIAERAS